MNDYRNIWLTAILILSDSFFYGYAHEKKNWFKWLFFVWQPKWSKHPFYPGYRILQWSLDLIVLYLVWIQGVYVFIGMLLAWYVMIKEGGYYTVLFQWKNLKADEILEKDMYWLKRFYFAGFWLFRDKFTVKRFAISCIIGLIILIGSNLI